MLPVYVILLNTDYQVLFANRYFREHFGEANGRQCFSYLFGRDGPCENCETFKVLRTHVPHHWEWVGPDGRNYDIYDFIFPGAGASPLIMEMGIDITDRKRAEAALLEANEMKLLGQLTSGVAHEVRNPLNGIIAIAEALSLEFSDSSRFEPFINHMRLQVTRLTSLMEELLTLGRPLRQETLNEISMVTLVETSLTTWLETLPARPMVQFIKPESPEKYKIKADTNTMAQVIINLLENAHNHSPRDEEIVCSVFELTAQMLVVFRIKDRGCGIAKNNVSRIFDPFFTTRKGGTGLGLSIVRHVVENHKGSVYAYNNTDGPGATFEVVLPMCVS
jgi:signal transduction histidine kinase